VSCSRRRRFPAVRFLFVTFMFYAYLWLREDGTPYYVGKGHGYRAYERTSHRVRRPIGNDRIIVQYYNSEQEAFEAERFFISYFGRKDLGKGCLGNLTDGGEGLAGAVRTEEWKRRIATANTGKKRTTPPYIRTEEHRRQLRDRQRGNKVAVGHGRPKGKHSPEEIAKRSLGIKAAWDRRKLAASR
jgi:hypothetical protein